MADYKGRVFEYVRNDEASKIKSDISFLIRELQKSLKEEGVTFNPVLVGPSKENFVTREVNGTTGIDIHYNLLLQKYPDKTAKQLRMLFLSTINNILKNKGFKNTINNYQSITALMPDRIEKEVIHSIDFAIVIDKKEQQDILIYDRKNSEYFFETRESINLLDDLTYDIKNNGLWEDLRDLYLNMKNYNDNKDIRTFEIYKEAIKNIMKK
ncbi:hypothetical protein [Haploplasma modicum]|uniref:hypothetical protein n=1 Tax=Haploplasma modicum TaxID=2150 RepID=UPI00214C5F10|nr:hypothetical protein [Haploplasma modicum]MCR1809191.1 hypothetical protein [Haploplasma modicum]